MRRAANIWKILRLEFLHIFTDKSVVMVMFGGVLFYALLYPLPYHKSIPGKQAIAVLDFDQSNLSRRLSRMAGSTPQLRIAENPGSMREAEEMLENGIVHGLLVIPSGFERDVYLGVPTTISFSGDASYFLIYGNVIEGLLTAATTLSVETQIVKEVMSGKNPAIIPGEIMSFRISPYGVFNPTGGYINYIVPAVFILILHQTLLIAAGTVTVKDRKMRKLALISTPESVSIVIRVCFFVAIYTMLSLMYFGFFFDLYGVPHSASQSSLIAFSLLFLSVTTVFAICIGYMLPRPELTTILVLLSSLPIVFTAGFVWPSDSLPAWLDNVTMLVPAKLGIQGFLSINQMGVSLLNLEKEIAGLLCLLLIFSLLLFYFLKKESTKISSDDSCR